VGEEEVTNGARALNPEKGMIMEQKLRWYKRVVPFLKDVRAELRKVTWPSRNEVTSTTIIVIIAIVFFGFYLFFMDVVFSWLLSQIKSFLA